MYEIPIVKDLKNCHLIDDAIKYIIDELTLQFSSNVERCSNSYYIEFSLNPEFTSPLHRYTCTVYVRENGQYNYSRERDEKTGDIYSVFTGIDIELSWPSFGGVDVNLCRDVLNLYSKINDTCVTLKSLYEHKLVRRVQTREDELKRELECMKTLNIRNVIAIITPHITGMRVSNKPRSMSVVNGPSIDEGDYEVEINKKKFFCNVSGLDVTFSRIA